MSTSPIDVAPAPAQGVSFTEDTFVVDLPQPTDTRTASVKDAVMKAVFKTAWGYQGNNVNLPVADVEAAFPFYQTVMGFRVVSRSDSPHKSAVLTRDGIQIGLAENGGNSSQDGCAFEVDDAEAAFAELRANGLAKDEPKFGIEQRGDAAWKVFYVVAPDGLCYWLGERQPSERAASEGDAG